MGAQSDWDIVKHVLENRRTAKPSGHFPHYVISKPAAKRLCAALGIRMPRAGYVVTLAHDPDGNEWVLTNMAGSSFYLDKYER